MIKSYKIVNNIKTFTKQLKFKIYKGKKIVADKNLIYRVFLLENE